jgi:hypothetical protein
MCRNCRPGGRLRTWGSALPMPITPGGSPRTRAVRPPRARPG